MVTPKGSMSTEGETIQVSVLPYRCSISWLLGAPDKRFSHTLDSFSRWPRPASSFRSPQAANLLEFHVPLTNCFVRRWFCAVHGPKPPLHRHNWPSFGKFQDTERFLIHCARHFSSRLPPSGGTCKYANAPSTKKKLREILYLLICFFLPCLSWLLRSQVRKFQRDLWITLYITCCCVFGPSFRHLKNSVSCPKMQVTVLPHALCTPGLSEFDSSYSRDMNTHLKTLLSWYSINNITAQLSRKLLPALLHLPTEIMAMIHQWR